MEQKDTIQYWKKAILETKSIVVDKLNLKKGQKVLVLCCGIGTEAFLIKEKIGENGYVLAIDVNKKAIKIANDRKEKYKIDNIDFIVEDANNIDKYINSFDRACCIFGMHYFDSKIYIIEKWLKCLKNEGELVIAEWLKTSSNNLIDTINEIIHKYLYESTRKNVENKVVSKGLIGNIEIYDVKFEFVYDSLQNYWDIYKKNDLFYKVKSDIGLKKYNQMLDEINQIIFNQNNNKIIELKDVRISIINKSMENKNEK